METDIRVKLARRIKKLRKNRGLTQEKLSELSGIDYKHIQLLESNKAPAAKLDTIEKLAKSFGLSPAELLKF